MFILNTGLNFFLYIFAIIVTAVLGFVVYRHDGKSATNKLFALLSTVIALWLGDLFLEQILVISGINLVWFARASIFLAVPEVVLILLLVLTIPKARMSLHHRWLVVLLSSSVIMMMINLSPLVFADEQVIEGFPKTTVGVLAPLFGVFMCGIVILSLSVLFYRIRHNEGIIRSQLKLMFLGFALMLGFLTFLLLLPTIILGKPAGLPFVPIAVFAFLFFTAIAILKYKLFNLKLLATQGLAVLLGLIIFVQFFIFDFKGAIFSRLLTFSVPQNLELIFGSLALLLCIYLGFTVIIKNNKSVTNWLFFILSLVLDAYIVINYLSLHPPGGAATQLFWIRLVMFICSFIGPALLLLVNNFPSNSWQIKAKYFVPIVILMIASASVSLLPMVFTGLQFPSGKPLPTPGPGMPIFLVDFVGLFIVSFVLLVYKYLKSSNEIKRALGFFTAGVILTFSVMAITTVISVVFLKSSAMVFIGPISSVLLVAFVAYAIIKHHIFNIKILAVELFVAFIAVILITEGIVLGTVGQSLFKLFFALLVCFVGYFLVNGVKKEIEQEREITRLQALAESNRQLQELDKQKTEFLNIAAHQLRTPVSIIKNYVAMLEDGDYGKVGAEVKQVHHNIGQSNEWLVRLADEFLNIANLEQGRTRFRFEEVNIVHLIDSVVKELKDRAESKGLKLVWDSGVSFPRRRESSHGINMALDGRNDSDVTGGIPPLRSFVASVGMTIAPRPAPSDPELAEGESRGRNDNTVGAQNLEPTPTAIYADPEKLRNVIFNFVDNAIKYSDKGEIRIEILEEEAKNNYSNYPNYSNEIPNSKLPNTKINGQEAGYTLRDARYGISVRVTDQGIGFNKVDEKVLFQKFQRGEQAKKHEANTSTGLGLYIAKMFVEGHGGYVWAASAGEGKGSEFGFWIPIKQ